MVNDIKEILDKMYDWRKVTSSVFKSMKASVLWCALNNIRGKTNQRRLYFNGQNIEKSDTRNT